MRRPYADFAPGVRKQATLPDGAVSLGIAGTAPGVVLDAGSCVVVVLPGPPGELQRLWPRAVESEPLQTDSRGSGHARAPRAPVLRRERVRRGEGPRRRGRRRGRGGGDDLRPRLRDSRRPDRRAGRRGTGRRARAGVRRAARRVPLRPRRALGAGARARAVPRPGPHARHRGVVHRRARRRPPHVGRRARATSSGAESSPTTTASRNELLGVSPALLAEHGAVSAEVARRDGDRRPRSGSASTWRSR